MKVSFKNIIKSLNLEGISVIDEQREEDHDIISIKGRLNGSGVWNSYLNQIQTIVQELNILYDVWIIDLINDCSNDNWMLRLGVRETNEDKHYLIKWCYPCEDQFHTFGFNVISSKARKILMNSLYRAVLNEPKDSKLEYYFGVNSFISTTFEEFKDIVAISTPISELEENILLDLFSSEYGITFLDDFISDLREKNILLMKR